MNDVKRIESLFDMGLYGEAIDLFKNCWLLSSTYVIETYGKEKVVAFFEMSKMSFMDVEDMEFLTEMPDKIHVFRGAPLEVKNIFDDFSWTIDRRVAEIYSNRIQGLVYEGIVDKGDVFAFISLEMELIVRPGTIRPFSSNLEKKL